MQTKLVLLELDAGDLGLLNQWADEGYLPTLAGLRQRGCTGRFAGPENACEHGARLSMFSGIPRIEHGHYWMRELVPGTYDLDVVKTDAVPVMPFWSRLENTGMSAAILDLPETSLVPGLPGVQLANWSSIQPDVSAVPPSSEPAEFLDEVREEVGRQVVFREFIPYQSVEQDRALYDQLLQRVATQGRLARTVVQKGNHDLIAIGFHEAHTSSHQFWKYMHASPGQDGKLAHAIRDVYQAIDREMGLLLEQVPGEPCVIVLSAFGMRHGFPIADILDDFCRKLDYAIPPAPNAGRAGPQGWIRRVLPERLKTWISQRLPRTTQERLLREHFRGSRDWSRTTAFSIPSLFSGFLRVNLKGREPGGIVEPGEPYRELLQRLEEDLLQLRDPQTGRCPVRAVRRAAELYGMEYPYRMPDILVEWEPVTHLRLELMHPRAVLRQPHPMYLRDNHHATDGFFIAAGPGVAPAQIQRDISLLDVAPTMLTLLGMETPPAWQGRSISEILTP